MTEKYTVSLELTGDPFLTSTEALDVLINCARLLKYSYIHKY